MKTAYTFYIENNTGKQTVIAKVADMNAAVILLSEYRRIYSASRELRCYIKPARKTPQLVDYYYI